MLGDDLSMRQACDTVFTFLQRYLNEPSNETREAFLKVTRHYLNKGYHFQLSHNSVTCTKHSVNNLTLIEGGAKCQPTSQL